jgi:hydrogenase maturation protease
MNLDRIEAIVNAVLYEGYILYPYRASSVKNRRRWTFGSVYPCEFTEDENSAASMQTECLVCGQPETAIEAHVRFLHLIRREIGSLPEPLTGLPDSGELAYSNVAALKIGGKTFHAWEEAAERDIAVPAMAIADLTAAAMRIPFAFAGARAREPLRGEDGRVSGVLIRTSADIAGEITIAACEVAAGVFRLTLRVENLTPMPPSSDGGRRADAQMRAFASTHMILGVRDGAFISLMDPPEALKDAAAACKNEGTWPVLAGEEGTAGTILSSPIILYDHPQVAPESPGDLFDATEIDELLTLRILAMTDEEKREAAAVDERARMLLIRSEALTQASMGSLHGTLREIRSSDKSDCPAGGSGPAAQSKAELAYVRAAGKDMRVGDRVRLKPGGRADIMDIVLKGEVAVIEAIERDFDGKIHLAVVIESDPGRELGLERMPGHRFFFSPDEIEPLLKGELS